MYEVPYAMMIYALSGAGLILIGFMHFGMTLAANYSLLRYCAEKAQVKQAEHDDQARLLNPPSYAQSTRQGPPTVAKGFFMPTAPPSFD